MNMKHEVDDLLQLDEILVHMNHIKYIYDSYVSLIYTRIYILKC